MTAERMSCLRTYVHLSVWRFTYQPRPHGTTSHAGMMDTQGAAEHEPAPEPEPGPPRSDPPAAASAAGPYDPRVFQPPHESTT